MNTLAPADWFGVSVWLACCFGYHLGSVRLEGQPASSLAAATAPLRRQWMRQAWMRENRVTDAALIGNLMQSATFFSSTTLLVLGGLFAMLGTVEKGQELVLLLPFARRTSIELLEAKTVGLTALFAYAFLRFTWSLRQFNLVNIVLGAYPPAVSSAHPDETLIRRAARLNELAGHNFTQGIRAYYYAVPLLLWLANPWLLASGSVVITAALYWMEFRSETVAALRIE